MESTVVVSRNYLNELKDTMVYEVEMRMLGCQNCKISSCPFPTKSECPINVLWKASEKPEEADFDLDELLPVGMSH